MKVAIDKSTIAIPLGAIGLKGELSIPQQAHSIVVFAHGSGSSRLSPRNQMVASYLNERGMATFLFDLLTPAEDKDYANRFNISLLAQRLRDTTFWLLELEEIKNMELGFFGASTGAAAALIASAEVPKVAAVVSRGGRPDLAIRILPNVKAATLLIVGGLDTEVIRLNAQAFNEIHCEKKMEIVPRATHLFSEVGTMEQVCSLAANWFEKYLKSKVHR